jgi:hypothetical protein
MILDNRAQNQRKWYQSVPARMAAMMLLFGLSIPMQTANSQDTGAQSRGGSARANKNNEIRVAVSSNIARSFKVDSISILIDDDVVSSQTSEGGQGRVLARFRGHIPAGKHRITALFTGIDYQNKVFKSEGSFVVTTGAGPKYIVLKISDDSDEERPTVSMEEW